MRLWKLILVLLSLSVLGAGGHAPVVPVSELPDFQTPHDWYGRPGWEERGEEYRRFLAPTARITYQNGGGGSGTICYYDAAENWAYVISCGHLFRNGRKTAAQYRQNPVTMRLELFYHDDEKLEKPEVYTAEVLFHIWEQGIKDVSLMRFHPTWKIKWVNSIAPLDLSLEVNKQYHSCGCDSLTETAHYLVTYHSITERLGSSEYVTMYNGPRPGRSGGGLFTDDHLLFGICSRGNGTYSFWTTVKQIHKYLKEEGFEFVLDGRSLANKIPIVDRNGPQGDYPKDYIPSPHD